MSSAAVINLNDTTPAAPAGQQNVKWQKGPQSGTDSSTGYPIFPVSAYITPSTKAPSIRTVTADDSVGSSDYTVLADASGGALTITFPASPATGRVLNVKKIDASANSMILDGNGNNIEGFTSVLITDGGTNVQMQYDGTQWRLL